MFICKAAFHLHRVGQDALEAENQNYESGYVLMPDSTVQRREEISSDDMQSYSTHGSRWLVIQHRPPFLHPVPLCSATKPFNKYLFKVWRWKKSFGTGLSKVTWGSGDGNKARVEEGLNR